jgi:F420-0:gamma-glutamyl ligase
MQFIPVKTRTLMPPQDDLLAVLDETLPPLMEGDILLVSSKVVAIHQGRCVSPSVANKKDLIIAEADVVIPRIYWNSPLTITNHAFIGAAGIDESNGDEHFILLPSDPFGFAQSLHAHVLKKHSLSTLGAIITDSHSTPLRLGATGIALAWWGIEPLQDHRGRLDLFGRPIKIERSNLVDGLAAGATVLAGEVDESIPVVIARGVPNVTYRDGLTRDQLFSEYKDDTFRVLYENYLPEDLRE